MHFPRTISSRWLDVIANYYFTINHRRASKHGDVDYLSCIGASTIPNGMEIDDEDDIEVNIPIQAELERVIALLIKILEYT